MTTYFHVLLYLLVIEGTLFSGCVATNAEKRLIATLTGNYETDERPVADENDTVNVTVDFALNQIIDMDEPTQILIFNAWLRLSWHDKALIWNPKEYNGTESIRLSADRLWKPDITIYNDVREELRDIESLYPVMVLANGTVNWNTPNIYRTSCILDVTYFPWDHQSCPIKLGSWTYDGLKLDINSVNSEGDKTVFLENGEWDLIGLPVKRNTQKYECCPEFYPDLTYSIVIKRKALYYTFNLILPCVFITLTAIMVFFLPPESGEKVSLGVTALLSLTVFLLLVAETMPPQSLVVPVIAQYFAAVIILLAVSTALTVVILNIHCRGNYKVDVPRWVRILVLEWFAKIVCFRTLVDANCKMEKDDRLFSQSRKYANELSEKTDSRNVKLNNISVISSESNAVQNHLAAESLSQKNMSNTDVLLTQILRTLDGFSEKGRSQDKQDQQKTDWMLVAAVLDRVMFCLFTVLTMIVCAVLLTKRTPSP